MGRIGKSVPRLAELVDRELDSGPTRRRLQGITQPRLGTGGGSIDGDIQILGEPPRFRDVELAERGPAFAEQTVVEGSRVDAVQHPRVDVVPLGVVGSDAEFRILSSHPVDDCMVAIVEITTSDGDAIARRYADAPEVRSSEAIHSDEGMVRIQYVAEVPELYELLSATGTLPRFPVSIRGGWLSIELTAPQEQLGEFTTELAAADIPYEILSVTQSYDSNGLLTERQREVITEAVERGYYDSPRDCTLIELAEMFEVNQSAASGVLHRAESQIVKEFIS